MRTPGRWIFFVLFTVSGFTGLIYESIWTHYLKLFLGHAAYAQTLVLAIYMGGLTAGSWFCSKRSHSWGNLLKGYALAEGTIGLCAILFHPVFKLVVDASYGAVIPALGTPAAINSYKWAISALLILPQTFLLGMTFPLMSAGVLRLFPGTPGKSIAMLYFTNSIGAAAGVLASGFVMIRLLGLPGTVVTAGVLNILLAAIVWSMAGRSVEAATPPASSPGASAASAAPYRVLLFISLATGAASFIYEIGWIRMLSLVLGSSTHAFELMLSAFILGLALGGLWIQGRIDRSRDPVRFLAFVQVVMGILALATLPVYGQSFRIMKALITSIPKTDNGYLLFNLSSSAIAMGVMLPTTFCAGMTLPLITYALIKGGAGERSIGAVYAANTVGAIAGVFLAVHIGMPALGLKGLIVAGGSLDMALGILLLWKYAAGSPTPRPAFAATAVCLCAAAAVVALVHLDPYKMVSGVYREGEILDPDETSLVFYKDGKTATVSVDLRRSGVMSIRTNGKSDAGVNVSRGKLDSGEESTMVLAAVIPMAYNPKARTVANIGLGSGLTTQTLLANPGLERVDTVEIEAEIVEGARSFGERVERVYSDPRSAIHVDDAKTFFSYCGRKYDIIVSEPSNPWVSGVAGLFSEEFYRSTARYLSDDGILVQWMQLYEINNDLVASVVKALSGIFADFVVYATDSFDIIIVARKAGDFPKLDPSIFQLREVADAARRVRVRSIQDLEARRIGDRKMLEAFFDMSPGRANSDFYPVLDQDAARARFLGSVAADLVALAAERLPMIDMLGGAGADDSAPTQVTFSREHVRTWCASTAMTLRDYCLYGSFVSYGRDPSAKTKEAAVKMVQMFQGRGDRSDPNRRTYIFSAASSMMPYLRPAECAKVWKTLESGPGAASLSLEEKAYVALFKAMGNRDGAAMAGISRTILEKEEKMTRNRLKYVLAAGMLGNISQGKMADAAWLWAQYQAEAFPKEQPDLLFRFLEAKSREAK